MMNHSTQAVVITEPGKVNLQEVKLKDPGQNDVIIETAFTSISAGTERMLLAGQMPHPMLQLPVVPGYETVGRIVSTGPGGDRRRLGQMVYVGGAMCYADVNGAWGGQSARLFVDGGRVVPLNGIDPKSGVLLALAATALHGVDLINHLTPNDAVMVLGQGPVGQLAARFLKGRGIKVIVVDKNSSRLQHSVADQVVDVSQGELADQIDGKVAAIVEATGSMSVLRDSLPHLDQKGTILLLGYYQSLDLPYMPLFLKEARLLTAKEWSPGDLARCRDYIRSGELDVSALITHQMPVSSIQQAYDVALNDGDCLKLILDWTK